MIHKVFELRSEMKKLAIMAGCGLLMALGAAGESATRTMPTQEELDKAVPLIQELMRDDLAAVRTGKKTREQIGDIAVALAKQAQSPAEKYLLLTSAFEHYMRGGSYDKANSSLADLRTAIPDWKHSDEYTLIEKSLRIIASGKGGPVRERYEELKERQQYASRLKKVLAQVKAKPSDKKLQFQVATYSAALDRWPQALDAFIAGSSPACAAAAKLEKESAAPGQIADAWWSAADIHPEFLSVAIRAHAVDLYKKAIAANSLAGLQKVVAEKRIAEVESAAVKESDVSADAKKEAAATKQGGNEWVHCEGGAVYLDTGIIPKSSMTIEWDVRFTPQHQGNKNFSGANTKGVGMCLNTDVKSVGALEIYNDKWHSGNNDGGLQIDTAKRNQIRWDSKGVFVNNDLVMALPIGNCSSSLVLFDRNRGGKPGGNSAACWVYGVRIKDNNRVLMDLKPKESKGVVGFWDSARNRFMLPSAGKLTIGRD